MGCFITWTDETNTRQLLRFDVTLASNEGGELDVSDHPVEEGFNVADNARIEQPTVSFTGFVSNTPIRGVDSNKVDARVQYGSMYTQLNYSVPIQPPPLPKINLGISPGAFFGAIGGAIQSFFPAPTYAANIISFDDPNSPTDAINALRDMLAALNEIQNNMTLVTVVTSQALYKNMLLKKFDLPRTPEDGTGGKFELHFTQLRVVSTKLVAAATPKQVQGAKKVSKGAQPPATPNADVTSLAGQGLQGFMGFLGAPVPVLTSTAP